MVTSPEFSRLVKVEEIAAAPLERRYTATAQECRNLAKRFNIQDVNQLSVIAFLSLRGDVVVLDGRLEADVVQACVVTLQPLPSHVVSEFSVRYLPAEMMAEADDEDADGITLYAGDDDIESLPADAIDVGEVAAQYLSLGLDPYPRAPEAPPPSAPPPEAPAGRANPFAVLKNLKERG